jgi:hypothetical protein
LAEPTKEEHVLARLGKTLSTNAAIAGLALVVLGAGGTTATLVASPAPSPNGHTPAIADEKKADAAEKRAEAAENAAEAEDSEEGEGTRPTDTHGYCVSQVAKTAPEEPTGTGADKVTHGSLVSAAAHACGKAAKTHARAPQAETKSQSGKAYGHGHGTGRPSGVTPGASSAAP